jgi:hypothetical protein
MAYNTTFSCSIGTTNASAPLGLEIWLDKDQIFNIDHIIETIDFCHNFNDEEGEHKICFVMKNKKLDDTQVDVNGNIIKDACVTIRNLALDDIDVNQVFIDSAVYEHNFNGTQPSSQVKFYGNLGCNGIVTVNFTTPIYLWLLERM